MAGDSWKICTLGELTDNFDSIRIPVKEADRSLGPYPYYGASGIVDYVDKYIFDGEYLLIAEDGENLRTRNTPVAFMAKGKFWVNNHAHIVRGNDKSDTRFLMYALANTDIGAYLTGSTMPKLTQGNLNRIKILTPPLPEQKAIAHILGTLDDKIELNRKMNETLEAMARAIFKSWFVDFDPVHAKRRGDPAGRPEKGDSPNRPYMTPEILSLFPDSFEDSELGRIPKGWRVGSVDDDFDLTMGQSPPGETYNETGEGQPFYQGRADFGFRYPNRRVFCTAPTRFAEAGDTLVSVRAPVGDINMAIERCSIGRGVAAARHKTKSRSYTYYFMHSLEHVFDQFEAEGTVFGSISKKDFHKIKCVIPPEGVVKTFEEIVFPMDQQIENNEQQSRSLATIRDTLLPKLLSGEIRTSEN